MKKLSSWHEHVFVAEGSPPDTSHLDGHEMSFGDVSISAYTLATGRGSVRVVGRTLFPEYLERAVLQHTVARLSLEGIKEHPLSAIVEASTSPQGAHPGESIWHSADVVIAVDKAFVAQVERRIRRKHHASTDHRCPGCYSEHLEHVGGFVLVDFEASTWSCFDCDLVSRGCALVPFDAPKPKPCPNCGVMDCAIWVHGQHLTGGELHRHHQRRTMDLFIAEDARKHPAFAGARSAAVRAVVERYRDATPKSVAHMLSILRLCEADRKITWGPESWKEWLGTLDVSERSRDEFTILFQIYERERARRAS